MKIMRLCVLFAFSSAVGIAQNTHSEFIKIADDNWHFETAQSGTPFTPFGTNYYDPASFGTSELWDNPGFDDFMSVFFSNYSLFRYSTFLETE